jgi:hypothetical protein
MKGTRLLIMLAILLGLALVWSEFSSSAPTGDEHFPDVWIEILATTLCEMPSPDNLIAQGETWILTCGQRIETYQVLYRPVIVSMTASGPGVKSLPLLLLPIAMVIVPGILIWRNQPQSAQKKEAHARKNQ